MKLVNKNQLTEFIQRSVLVYKNKYDYVEVRERFQHMYSRIPVLCASHGRFWVVAKAHLKGEACIKCERKEAKQLDQRRQTTLITRDRAMERVLPGYKHLLALEKNSVQTPGDRSEKVDTVSGSSQMRIGPTELDK